MLIPTPSSGDLSLYFHLPFCTKKCDYCHFYVVPDKPIFKDRLLEALHLEIEQKRPLIQSKRLVSIYFGGGTPALVGPDFIESILKTLKQITSLKEVEITLELNPENQDTDQLKRYFEVGINRLSIGVQSFDEVLLKKLGRVHSAQESLNAIQAAVNAGYQNISIDLMYDLPNQTMKSWLQTLETACSLPIQHISLYNLSIEPHTVFFKYRERIEKQLPSREQALKMYEAALEAFSRKQFWHYEISAFCQSKLYSRHNTGYWLQRPHLGFGPSAYSFDGQKRFQNTANLNRYHKAMLQHESAIETCEELSSDERLKESLALHLRLVDGFDLEDFQRRFGTLNQEIKKTLNLLEQHQMIRRNHNILSLTSQGLLRHDAIASEII